MSFRLWWPWRRVGRTERHLGLFALLEALTKPGCAICRRQEEGARRALAVLFHELVNDGEVRTHLRRSWGFCPEHARMALACGDPLGLSIIYRDLVGGYTLGSGEKQAAGCPICETSAETERIALEVWRTHWEDPQLRERLARADLLCRVHLERLLAMLPKGAAREEVRAWAEQRLRALEGDLASFVQHCREEGSGTMLTRRQATAWKAAMAFFSRPGVVRSNPQSSTEPDDRESDA